MREENDILIVTCEELLVCLHNWDESHNIARQFVRFIHLSASRVSYVSFKAVLLHSICDMWKRTISQDFVESCHTFLSVTDLLVCLVCSLKSWSLLRCNLANLSRADIFLKEEAFCWNPFQAYLFSLFLTHVMIFNILWHINIININRG